MRLASCRSSTHSYPPTVGETVIPAVLALIATARCSSPAAPVNRKAACPKLDLQSETPSANTSNSAHSGLGPSWAASVVNAVGESSYWQSTAIIVLWDDWGGWYDNAAPKQLDYRGLGIRSPV
ncbi:MAG: alkaline phosphatase family protein [Candidatus Cybelea sp.]